MILLAQFVLADMARSSVASYCSPQLWDGHLGDSYAIMVDLGLLIKWQCAYTGTSVMCCSVKGGAGV